MAKPSLSVTGASMSDSRYDTMWRYVHRGATVLVKGITWQVVADDPMTLKHKTFGIRIGTPMPNAAVTVLLPPLHDVTLAQAVGLVREGLGGTIVSRG